LTQDEKGLFKRKPVKKKTGKTRQTRSDSEIERDRALIVIEEMSNEMTRVKESLKKERQRVKDLEEELEQLKETMTNEMSTVLEDTDRAKKDRALAKRQLTIERQKTERQDRDTAVLRSALQNYIDASPPTCAAPAGNAPTTATTPTTTPPNPTSKPTRKFKGAAVKRQRTTDLWAGPLRVALDTHFAEEAVDAKRTALEKVLEEMPVLPVEGELEGASDVRYFRAMNKVAGDPFDFPRVAALHKMLIAISSKTVQAALRGDLLDDFVFRTEKKLIFNIQESYDTHTCLNLKLKNLMGREKWNRLRLLLSSIFVDGTWRRKLVGESQLPVPMLPEARTLLTLQREIEEEFSMSLDGDMEGKSVKACLNACLVADCKYAQGQGFLEPAGEEFEGALPALVQSCNKRGLCVQFKMDACQSWKGVKQTAIAYRFPRASKTAGSPFDTSEIALFEGDDHWDSVAVHARGTLRSINGYIENPVLEVDGHQTALDICAGCDLSNGNDMLCVSSCKGPCPCMWCEVKSEAMNPALKLGAPPVRRTLERILLFAHRACGQCPGCKMQIVATEAEVLDPTKQVMMAQAGDAEPPKSQYSAYLRFLKLTWLAAHAGIVYGRHPLLRIQPDKWYMCLLHFNLRVTSGNINHTIFIHLGKFGDAAEQAKAIVAILSAAGIWVNEKRLAPKSKKKDAPHKKDISFVGRDAVGLHSLAEKLMDVVIPPAEREEDEDTKYVYDKAMVVWNVWRDLWRLLNNGFNDVDDPAEREVRAKEVQELADAYRVAWCRSVGSTKGLYIHIMHEHLADQVRAVGDLRPYQSQGLEHLHSFRKLIARHLTNRKIKLTASCKRNRVMQSFSVQMASKQMMRLQATGQDQKDHARRAKFTARTRAKRVAAVAETGRVKVL
jgi:hypothetical protein